MPKLRGSDGKENIVPQEKEAANIFEVLSLEEPKDGVDSPNLSSSVSPGPKAEHMATSKPVWHMESFYEVLFSSVLFFQDL